MAEFPYMPLWTDAYLADTTHLTTIEHGAYLLLLMAAWRAGGYLPDDDRKLRRITKADSRQWQKIRAAMQEFWSIEDGRWVNKRVLRELDLSRRLNQQRAAAGRASALKRKESASTSVAPPLQRKSSTHTHTQNHREEGTPLDPPNGVSHPPSGDEDGVPASWGSVDDSKPKKPSGRGARLPDGWEPCERAREFARGKGMTDEEIDDEADRFRDYWHSRAGAGARKIDWLGTWRNRIRDIAGDTRRRRGKAGNGLDRGDRREPDGWTGAAERVLARFDKS